MPRRAGVKHALSCPLLTRRAGVPHTVSARLPSPRPVPRHAGVSTRGCTPRSHPVPRRTGDTPRPSP
eukprot:3740727-Prymnesium_polylepis.1